MPYPEDYRLYCDRMTQSCIDDRTLSKVILIGSCFGYSNFGDILQLKGTIKWHKEKTGLEPVILFDLSSIRDIYSLEQMRQWYGVTSILFFSQGKIDPKDLEKFGLASLTVGSQIPYLHLYGGGFLNNWWGHQILALVELTYVLFGVNHYVISGQQINPDFTEALSEHFHRCPPLIAGGRDRTSAEVMKSIGLASARYSFDDAFEPLREITTQIRQASSNRDRILIHINTSHYASNEGDSVLKQPSLEDSLKLLKQYVVDNNKATEITLLQAYHHSNRYYVNDTLQTLLLLEEKFPFINYSCCDLAQVALRFWTSNSELPELNISPKSVAISSSYHVAMFCGMLEIPCFLQDLNGYYSQKKNGLGLKAKNLNAFLESPEKLQIEQWGDIRAAWQEEMLAVYRQHSVNYTNSCKVPTSGAWSENTPTQRLVFNREDYIKIELEQTQSYLQAESQKSENLWAELCQYKQELERSQSQLQAEGQKIESLWNEMLHYKQEAEEVHSQLQQVYCQLQAEQQKSENLWAELAESKQELKQSQQNLERLQHQIAAMESSKFWQLRQEWFKLKRIFRVSAE
jgi:hypothetical protein